MSLYAFGAIAADPERSVRVIWEGLSSMASHADVGLSRGLLDDDDAPMLDDAIAAAGLAPLRVAFTIRDDDSSGEATALWNEAHGLIHTSLVETAERWLDTRQWDDAQRMRCQKLALSSRLGAFLKTLVTSHASGGAIAMFDGCVDRVITGRPDTCLERMLLGLRLPWHACDNAIYAWNARSHGQLSEILVPD